jgi:RNA polymerase sigma factor (sigma-70 family)
VPLDAANDSLIFQSLQAGDDSALDQLIRRWEKPLFAFAWRYTRNSADAEDVVAETFVRLYRRRNQLRADTRLSAWLFTTLTNLCHNQHRWRQRHPAVSFDATGPGEENGPLPASLISEGPRPLAIMERNEILATLQSAIETLPHDLKTAILLHHYELLSYRQIGEIVGCSERGVETRLYRAKQRLRAALTREGEKRPPNPPA